jgi:hypothetical protein
LFKTLITTGGEEDGEMRLNKLSRKKEESWRTYAESNGAMIATVAPAQQE